MLKNPLISESELIQKCKHGDLKYLEKLYKHFYGYAMGVGLRYLPDRNDALEVVNDAFIKVFKSISQFESEKTFKPWLRKIIVNTAIDRRRKDMKLLYQADLETAGNVSTNPGAIENLQASDILKLLNRLPEIHRTVFNLYEIDGYSHEEIGQMLGIPASSSRVNLSRAKEKLRKTWQQENGIYERTS
ncbi:RNA polymerase sigma factor [Flavihumibacter sp. R14]|nr:RNA polymerase sigma factor [Flavihumibacter soli]